MTRPCNPVPPVKRTSLVTGNKAPNRQTRIAVGRFRCASSFTDRVNRILAILNGPQVVPINDNMEFLYETLTYNSTEVEFFSNAQVNQIVTFFLKPEVVPLISNSHRENIPVYANVVEQLPQYSHTEGNFIPNTLGQLNLQFNRYLNPHVVYGIAMPLIGGNITNTADVLSLLPALTRFLVKENTPIYKGVL